MTSLFPIISMVSFVAFLTSHPMRRGACNFHLFICTKTVAAAKRPSRKSKIANQRVKIYTVQHLRNGPNTEMDFIFIFCHSSIAHFKHVRICSNLIKQQQMVSKNDLPIVVSYLADYKETLTIPSTGPCKFGINFIHVSSRRHTVE